MQEFEQKILNAFSKDSTFSEVSHNFNLDHLFLDN
jgi:hypothetical protein